VGAGILSVVLPKSYRSQTLIFVESQKIPENYVQAILGPSIEERLYSLQQQLMSRTVLTQLVEEYDLYPDIVLTAGIDAVIERLRKDILVSTTGPQVSGGRVEAFSISFAHGDPMTAMKVATKLASDFIESNLKAREQRVEAASEFIEQELALAKERLEAQERTITTFKTKNMGGLPEQVQANLSALDRLQAQHNGVSEAIQKSTDRLTLIEKMLQEYESPGPAAVVSLHSSGGTVVLDPHVHRLNELEKNLITLSAEYKDNYPDIIYLKQEIQSLKAQLKDKKNTVGEKDEPGKSSDLAKGVKPTDLYLRELIRQREEARLEMASLKDRLVGTKAEMRRYEERVEQVPRREQELGILVRDYNNLKENYRTLLDKKLNARLSENLEKRQKGEQFRIVDPAHLPTTPEKPDRLKIMLIGLALGCGLGLGSAVALESFRPVFRRSVDVEHLFQFRVLASIPTFRATLGWTDKLVSRSEITYRPSGDVKDLLPPGRIAGDTQKNGSGDNSLGKYSKPTNLAVRHSNSNGVRREWDLIVKWNPASVVAEQFRVAATRLVLHQSKSSGNVTVVTSALKGEGKSMVAANLAYTLARDMGKRVLLVDGDLKCSMVHQCMGIPQSPGVSDVLLGIQPMDSCLRREGELPLWILPSGRGNRTLDLSKIQKIEGMLAETKGQYDHIIVDAPPILPLADMHVLAEMADVLILVIRAGLTPRSVVEDAVHAVGAKDDTCIILNGLETSGVPYYMQESFEYVQESQKSNPYQRRS